MTNELKKLQEILQLEFSRGFTDEETKTIGGNLMGMFDLILTNLESHE